MKRRAQLCAAVARLEHVLPAQAPIRDFVHHNTLHGFQHLKFDAALAEAAHKLHVQVALPISRSRELYRTGRITHDDLRAALQEEHAASLDAVVVRVGNRHLTGFDLWWVALRHDIRPLPVDRLAWLMEEADAIEKFRPDVEATARVPLIGDAAAGDARAALRELWRACGAVLGVTLPETGAELREAQLDEPPVCTATEVRLHGLSLIESLLGEVGRTQTIGALLDALTGQDTRNNLRAIIVRQVAAHLDLGIAAWRNPVEAHGLYTAFRSLARNDLQWPLAGLSGWRDALHSLPDDPVDAIERELRLLGIPDEHAGRYLELLALSVPGWAGMWHWRARHPQFAGSTTPVAMMDYLAVSLVVERLQAQHLCQLHWNIEASLPVLRGHFRRHPAELLVRHALHAGGMPESLAACTQALAQKQYSHDDDNDASEWMRIASATLAIQRKDTRAPAVLAAATAWPLFCLCQYLGIPAAGLLEIGRAGAEALLGAARSLDDHRAGQIWLRAYERHYREMVFRGLSANRGRAGKLSPPFAQLVFCMDDREEGMRRHIEEVNPLIETYGAAGFFGVAINWRGLDDDAPSPLCPIVVTPSHNVDELPASEAGILANRHRARRNWRLSRRDRIVHGASRGLLSPVLYGALMAPVAALLMFGRLRFPYRTARLRSRLRDAVDLAVPTRVNILAAGNAPVATPQSPRAGFTDREQADRVEGFLRTIGLVSGFSTLVVMVGHGSASENNPHRSAYDCGACSGRHGGPNARVFAAMANRHEVRAILAERGMRIPISTWVVGAEHNTCNDTYTFYDADLVPAANRNALERLRRELVEASRWHALERCRRFASASQALGPRRAQHHVWRRTHDMSQARPELGHATNASAVIGRRTLSRGLFLDRRAFLISYDPGTDPEGNILEAILLAAGPVGAGISLEYYFSTVDSDRLGCGTKTVHNITGLFGVMEGAGSDLRTGLPRQMTEIHEPMRLLIVVEHRLAVLNAIYARQPALRELIGNGWVQLAALDPESAAIHVFDAERGWIAWQGRANSLPTVTRSVDWFRGHQDALGPALIRRPVEQTRD